MFEKIKDWSRSLQDWRPRCGAAGGAWRMLRSVGKYGLWKLMENNTTNGGNSPKPNARGNGEVCQLREHGN